MTIEITREPSVTYKVRSIPEGGWADVNIRSWERGGSLMIQSDFGEYSHVWTSIGDCTFIEFLCDLDKDYFLKKTRPKDYLVFDDEATVAAMKKDIVQQRRERYINADVAREAWNDVDNCEMHSCNETEFFTLLRDTDTFSNLYECDYCAVPMVQKYHPHCDLFWERVWLRLIEYWKDQTKQ